MWILRLGAKLCGLRMDCVLSAKKGSLCQAISVINKTTMMTAAILNKRKILVFSAKVVFILPARG